MPIPRGDARPPIAAQQRETFVGLCSARRA